MTRSIAQACQPDREILTTSLSEERTAANERQTACRLGRVVDPNHTLIGMDSEEIDEELLAKLSALYIQVPAEEGGFEYATTEAVSESEPESSHAYLESKAEFFLTNVGERVVERSDNMPHAAFIQRDFLKAFFGPMPDCRANLTGLSSESNSFEYERLPTQEFLSRANQPWLTAVPDDQPTSYSYHRNLSHQIDSGMDLDASVKNVAAFAPPLDPSRPPVFSKESDIDVNNQIHESMPSAVSSWAATRPTARSMYRRCTACQEYIRFFDTARVACNHEYCRGCLQDLFRASMIDNSLFPPRYYNQFILTKIVMIFLIVELLR
jgi:hypothetical protein